MHSFTIPVSMPRAERVLNHDEIKRSFSKVYLLILSSISLLFARNAVVLPVAWPLTRVAV